MTEPGLQIAKVVQAMQVDGLPNFMRGHRLEIANRLLNADKSVNKAVKYPLVVLIMDFPEEKDAGIVRCKFNIGILTLTDRNYNVEERMENVFRPILYPLYQKFLDKLPYGQFMWDGADKEPPHTKIDRPFWGTTALEKNEKYIFNDPLDCVELVDLKMNLNIKC